MRRPLILISLVVSMLLSGPLLAQTGSVAFGNFDRDDDAPVEVTADNLNVNQNDNSAVFTGNVVIGQGGMRLTAPEVRVIYDENQSKIKKLLASGGATLVSGEDAAEAQNAEYDLDAGMIFLQGNVLLVQGDTSVAAERVTVDLESGTARMSGRVRTILQQGGQ